MGKITNKYKTFQLSSSEIIKIMKDALTLVKEDYGKDRINLSKIIGSDKAKRIAINAHTAANYASVDKLISSGYVLFDLWKEINIIIPKSDHKNRDRIIQTIVSILLKEIPVIKSYGDRFKHFKPLEDIATIDPVTGTIVLPTTRWTKDGVKVPSSISFDSLPKAIRSAQHTIDSLTAEYEENKKIIIDLIKINTYIPMLGRGSSEDDRKRFAAEIQRIAEKLKRKRHGLKINAREMLSTRDEKVDAVSLLLSSSDPEKIRTRRERNWPAARAKIVAAIDRLTLRNIEIVEKLTPGMYIRKQKLLQGYEYYITLHKYIDKHIERFITLLYTLRKSKDRKEKHNLNLNKHLKHEKQRIIDLINNWLAPYIHDTSYNRWLWIVGKHLVESVRALGKGDLQTAIDEVFKARKAQVMHYQALLVDKEGKGIEA